MQRHLLSTLKALLGLGGITVLAKGRRAVDECHQMVHHGDKYAPQSYLDFQVLQPPVHMLT